MVLKLTMVLHVLIVFNGGEDVPTVPCMFPQLIPIHGFYRLYTIQLLCHYTLCKRPLQREENQNEVDVIERGVLSNHAGKRKKKEQRLSPDVATKPFRDW